MYNIICDIYAYHICKHEACEYEILYKNCQVHYTNTKFVEQKCIYGNKHLSSF